MDLAPVQMPTGTGKTITLLSLITSYQLAHPEVKCAPHFPVHAPERQLKLCQAHRQTSSEV